MFRLIVGFLLGVIIARNYGAMQMPILATVIVFTIAGFWLFYRYGKRDVNVAVATAVAVANAKAEAAAEAKAQAIANAAVHIYQMSGQVPTPREIVTYSTGEISNDHDSGERITFDNSEVARQAISRS